MQITCPYCAANFGADSSGETEAIRPPSAQETLGSAPPRPASAQDAPRGRGRGSSRYEIIGELGRGGMGVVYRAHDSKLNRVVALKILIAGEGASEEEVERFFREATAAVRPRHSNTVAVHELDVKEGRPCFTMGIIGTTLQAVDST